MILAVTSNVVLSLGMVGALSIVRFRTAIKEPLDIAFLFWAVVDGIVLGAGMIPLAVIGSVVVGLVLLFFVNRKSHRHPYIVVFRCVDQAAEQKAGSYISSMTERSVIKSKSASEDGIEVNLEVQLRGANTDFINAVSAMPGVKSAVLVSYNGDYMG